MDVQHEIRRQLARPESVHHFTEVVDAGNIPHRMALAECLCADPGFRDGRGQVSTFRVAAVRRRQPSGEQLEVAGRHRGSWPAGLRPRCGGRGQDSLYPSTGGGLARPGVSPPLANTITLDPADGLAGPRRSLAAPRSAMPARAPVRWRLRREHDRRCPFRRPRAATGPGSRATTGSSTRTALTPAAILAPHRARTLEHTRSEPVVLCLQGGTDLNFRCPDLMS